MVASSRVVTRQIICAFPLPNVVFDVYVVTMVVVLPLPNLNVLKSYPPRKATQISKSYFLVCEVVQDLLGFRVVFG